MKFNSLFAVGELVRVSRIGGKPLTINGNAGQTILPANDVGGELRTIKAVRSRDWIMTRQKDSKDIYTEFPKASQIIECKPGFIKFNYDNGLTVTITKEIK